MITDKFTYRVILDALNSNTFIVVILDEAGAVVAVTSLPAADLDKAEDVAIKGFTRYLMAGG